MNKKVSINNIIWGLLLLLHFTFYIIYKPRLKNKLSFSRVNKLNDAKELIINGKAGLIENFPIKQYLEYDHIYVEFYNFDTLPSQELEKVSSEIKEIYKTLFLKLHTPFIFFRTRNSKSIKNYSILNQVHEFHDSVTKRVNFYFIYFVNGNGSRLVEATPNAVVCEVNSQNIFELAFLKRSLRRFFYHLKSVDSLPEEQHNLDIPSAYTKIYTNLLYEKVEKTIDSIIYAQYNLNIAFKKEYLLKIEQLSDDLAEAVAKKDINFLKTFSNLNDIHIYKSVYVYEPYLVSIVISTVLLIFSPFIKIFTEKLRHAIFSLIDSEEEENLSLLQKIYTRLIEK